MAQYANTSVDAIHSYELKQNTFREKVWEYFHKHNTFGTTRTAISLTSRWGMIDKETNRFCGCMAQVKAISQSGTTEQDKIDNAKALYKNNFHLKFQFEHCWLMLKDQPEWSEPKERSRTLLPPAPDSTSIVEGDGVSLLDDVSNFRRPIGRKAEKANRKNKAIEKTVGEYLAKKMKFIEESQKQEKDRIKAEMVHLKELRDTVYRERIQLEKEKLRIEKEKLRIQEMFDDERIMLVDTSTLAGVQKLFYEQLQREIIARRTSSK
ncbi:glutathione S-transferase T3-like [Quercus lobata]|uniref:No apical meristem-associated C-terminal domain-containing protein n=1 Tax=Quercus lobata TaxID=97700 RepID=A0A7N2MY93_QUELO|nr:glutathione S-transferase T3-like [Quercus lobata]